jgi:hypothetical protein
MNKRIRVPHMCRGDYPQSMTLGPQKLGGAENFD